MNNSDSNDSLKKELAELENQGVKLLLDGVQYDADSLAEKLIVCEPSSYMRDYICENDILSELHFDNIVKTKVKKKRRFNRRNHDLDFLL